jgi:hypothetical protein
VETGGVLIDGGNIILDDVTFSLNLLSKSSSFPNLRHNVFVANGAIVNVQSITVDTPPSNFVYVSDDGTGSTVLGLDV